MSPEKRRKLSHDAEASVSSSSKAGSAEPEAVEATSDKTFKDLVGTKAFFSL